MKTLTLINLNLLCYLIFKLTIVSCINERKNSFKYSKRSEKFQNVLRSQLLENLGLRSDDMVKTEEYAKLSERLPHLVPDFMRSLFERYRFKLFNLSLEIGGRRKHLGPIEIIQSHRLKEIHTWPKIGIHKLIFKEATVPNGDQLYVRELRLNTKLFPKKIPTKQKNRNKILTIMKIFDKQFRVVKNMVIRNSSFSKEGWLSVDISENLDDCVFFIKFFRISRIGKDNFTKIDLDIFPTQSKELYLYYAHIINFYRNGLNHVSKERPEFEDIAFYPHRRLKRDLNEFVVGHNDDCQRYPLVVTFKEVGWSKWIIAPQNYNAYYCKGNCPYPLSDNFNATNHAIIQLLVHGLRDVSVPKPCCVPYHLTPETLLYLNNDGDALLREFKDMSVSSCSCR